MATDSETSVSPEELAAAAEGSTGTGTQAAVLGAAPAFAAGVLYQSTAQALALAAQNATAAQQNVNTLLGAVTAASVARMLGSKVATDAPGTARLHPLAAGAAKPAAKRTRATKKADNGS